MENDHSIKLNYIDPERDAFGLTVSNAMYEVDRESLQEFVNKMQEILPKKFDSYTYADDMEEEGKSEFDVVLESLGNNEDDDISYSEEGNETNGDNIYYNQEWGIYGIYDRNPVPFISDYREGFKNCVTYLFEPETMKLFGICKEGKKYEPITLKEWTQQNSVTQ